MAGFDATLDKEIFSKKVEFANTTIKVSVMSYNDGPKKIQISRESPEEARFMKLGRLTKQEAEGVIPALQEAITHLE